MESEITYLVYDKTNKLNNQPIILKSVVDCSLNIIQTEVAHIIQLNKKSNTLNSNN